MSAGAYHIFDNGYDGTDAHSALSAETIAKSRVKPGRDEPHPIRSGGLVSSPSDPLHDLSSQDTERYRGSGDAGTIPTIHASEVARA